jgi:hypothetical protein
MRSSTTHPTQASTPDQPVFHRFQALMLTLALTLLCTLPLILSGNANGRAAADDYNYHWIAIQKFAIEWPSPDVSDYQSATTPGYHLLLAPLVHAGLGHMGTQLVALIWTLALFGLLCWYASRTLGRAAALVCLPLIVSMYTLFPGVWLLPDNAGWFFVLSMLLISLRASTGWHCWLASGVLLTALVFMRQIHIWIAATVWLAAWLGSDTPGPATLRAFFQDGLARTGRAFIAIACTIPAFGLLVWFLLMWGGLVPPMFQGQHQGPNPATPGFILLQLAILSVFFLPILLPRLKALWAHQWRWVLLSLGIGVLLALLPASSYSVEGGRFGGWWNLVRIAGSIADRSPVYVIGAIAGAAVLPIWLSLVPRRDAWVWVGTMIAFTLAQSANLESWQRYHEPMLLIMIALILTRSELFRTSRVRVMIGTLGLSGMLAVLTVSSLIQAKPYKPIENPFETRAQVNAIIEVP